MDSSACGLMTYEVKKKNGGNSEAAYCVAAPFPEKALWVLGYLDVQDSALQPCPRTSLKSQFGFLKEL